MNRDTASDWSHDHTFGQDQRRPGERRTLAVIIITATMMVVEIICGIMFGSMALLADGLHMASHAVALAIAYFAYVFARWYAKDERFTFGTGKVNSLAGFTGAVLLAVFAIMMAWESIDRLISPVDIRFNQAIVVAVVGLAVNAACAVILGGHGHSDTGNDQHDHADGGDRPHEHHHHDDEDHNLRSAYLHVIADALTSLLAIVALLAGKYFGVEWMDPVMGIVGSVLVARWSIGLARATSRVLLDRRAPARIREAVREAIEVDGATEVSDMHIWSIGPGLYAVAIAVVAKSPQPPQEYKARIPQGLGLVHIAVEINSDPSAGILPAADVQRTNSDDAPN